MKNFRSLKEVSIPFEQDITVLIGENDSGKTSIIDILKILFDEKVVEEDDFYYGSNEIIIKIEFEDLKYMKKFILEDSNIESSVFIEITDDFLQILKDTLDSEEFQLQNDDDKKEYMMEKADILGVHYRSNIGIDTLHTRLIERIDEISEMEDERIQGNIPNKNIYFLDGKRFEDISIFFSEFFFKEKKRDIWNEEINGFTIEELINDKLESYSSELKQKIDNKGIKEKLNEYLPELTDIVIKSTFKPRDADMDVNVQLLEDGKEISVEKKGDGTKRRITMALLEYQKAEKEEPSLYVFDEPDTHLHVRAQMELLEIMRAFCENDKQVIIATHSPFIMNSVKPRQIKLLSLKNRQTELKSILNEEEIESQLNHLGIENIHLFFSKRMLVVEGETEEIFIPLIFKKLFDKPLNSNLVHIIKRKGITDVPRFTEILTEFIKPEKIFLLVDNDSDEETETLIENLELPERNIFKIGEKEFEDSFSDEIIYSAWKGYVEDNGRCIGEQWTIENIRELKTTCSEEGLKFSKELKNLNGGCQIAMKKILFGKVLAQYCSRENLPDILNCLLERLCE